MSRTRRKIPDVHKEMAVVFKRKSGPQIRPISRQKEREEWKREWRDTTDEVSNAAC